MMDVLDIFLKAVGVFFLIYMIGYSTFLFLSVLVGSGGTVSDSSAKTVEKCTAERLLCAHQHCGSGL